MEQLLLLYPKFFAKNQVFYYARLLYLLFANNQSNPYLVLLPMGLVELEDRIYIPKDLGILLLYLAM